MQSTGAGETCGVPRGGGEKHNLDSCPLVWTVTVQFPAGPTIFAPRLISADSYFGPCVIPGRPAREAILNQLCLRHATSMIGKAGGGGSDGCLVTPGTEIQTR